MDTEAPPAANASELDLKSTIIEFMRHRPFLWNMKHPIYKDTKRRETEFELFSQQLKLPVKEIKRVWHVLRTNFFRAHKILIEKPPDYEGQDKLWKYYTSMTYILPDDYHMQQQQLHYTNSNSNIHESTICNNYTIHDCTSNNNNNNNSTSRQASPVLASALVVSATLDNGQARNRSQQQQQQHNNNNHSSDAIPNATTLDNSNSNYNASPHKDNPTQINSTAGSATNHFVTHIVSSDNNSWASSTAQTQQSSQALRGAAESLKIECNAIASSQTPKAKRIRKINSDSNNNNMDNNSAGNNSSLNSKYSIPLTATSKQQQPANTEHPQTSVDSLLGDLKDDDELYARALACSLRKFDPTTKEIVKLKFQEIIVKYMQQRRQRLYIVPRTVDSKSTD